MNYHRAHVPIFASLMSSLYILAHAHEKPIWEQEQEESFLKTKQALSCAPCLAYPNPSDKFVIDTDASDLSIGGAIFSQLQDGKEVVICYAGHVLIKPQRKYWHNTEGVADSCHVLQAFQVLSAGTTICTTY